MDQQETCPKSIIHIIVVVVVVVEMLAELSSAH